MTTPEAVHDAIFLDPQEALECARLRRRVAVWGSAEGCQVCYYTADAPLPERLDNLVHLHPTRMLQELVETRLRLPTVIVMPEGLPEEMRSGYSDILTSVLHEAKERRRQRAQDLVARIARLAPRPAAGRPLRVLAIADLTTTVTQYSSRGLVEAFKALGHDAHLIIERNDCECIKGWPRLQPIAEMNPDIIILVNLHVPWCCPPGTVQVVWWQDPMPALREPTPLPWRRQDLVYIVDGYFRAGVLGTGLQPERIRTQHFCVDDVVFHPPAAPGPRRRAVVFVGTSYRPFVNFDDPGECELVRRIDALVDAGGPVDGERVAALATACGVDPTWAVCRILLFCTRDRIVRQLCRQSGMAVEIYGLGWENDPEVAPFHRGPIQHGAPLAELYRSVTHALCLHPFLINHQRLAEIGACGCIPVCWDSRAIAEAPHWEEEILYFRDAASLLAALARTPDVFPERFREHFSYRRFAQRIIDDARDEGLLPAEVA